MPHRQNPRTIQYLGVRGCILTLNDLNLTWSLHSIVARKGQRKHPHVILVINRGESVDYAQELFPSSQHRLLSAIAPTPTLTRNARL